MENYYKERKVMKKIYSILLILASMLVFAPFIGAQTIDSSIEFPDDDGTYTLDDSGFAYKKQISKPKSDGTYWIKLESFVTGTLQIKQQSTPADIVLVLDCSGSMKFNMDGSQTSGVPETQQRLYALKTAVKAFIEQIDINDLKDPETGEERPSGRLGNTISIVTFNANGGSQTLETLVPLTSKEDLISTIDGLGTNQGTYSAEGMQRAYNILSKLPSTRKLRTTVFFTDGLPASGWQETWNNTRLNEANNTIAQANNIKNLANSTTGVMSNVFSVSIIDRSRMSTKNAAMTEVYLGKTSSDYLGATNMGTNSNNWNTNNMWGNGDGTKNTSETEFSITATTVEDLIAAFETIAGDSGGAGIDVSAESVSAVDVVSASFMLPSGANENSILVYTAPCLQYSEEKHTITIEGEEYLYFGTETLKPYSGDTYDKYETIDGVKTLVEEDVDVDNSITVTLSSSTGSTKTNKINVTGFDFSNNWCGPEKDEDGNITGVHGHKLIILIPIQMDPEAVGGPNVATNGSESGIYINGVSGTFVEFNEKPTVSLPVNIHIRKEGLDEGESAKFLIQRAIIPDTWPSSPTIEDYNGLEWDDVTSVFVTRHSGQDKEGENAPITKVVGMPSTTTVGAVQKEFIYRVKEENWSWKYHTSAAITTSDKLITNPFVFTNIKKDDDIDIMVRNAESKATNTFINSEKGGVTYDDSKTNTGEGRETK